MSHGCIIALLLLCSVTIATGLVHSVSYKNCNLNRLFSVVDNDGNAVNSKQLLQTMLSNDRSSKERAVALLRNLRGNSNEQYNVLLSQMLSEIERVRNNRWAMTRWPRIVPIFSYRVKLGTMCRLLDIINNEEADSSSVRSLGILLSQLVNTNIRKLEREAIRRSKQSTSMEEMLKRTPEGLETPSYTVVKRYSQWEVRRYEKFSVCSSAMDDSIDDLNKKPQAPGQAFNKLAGYIFGKNQQQQAMAMTTPVISTSDRSRMSFVMPSAYWGDDNQLGTAPKPLKDVDVKLCNDGGGLLPSNTTANNEGLVAVQWFGGYATQSNTEQKAEQLRNAIIEDGNYDIRDGSDSSYILLQYNDPFVPPWKRRNEVAFPVASH